ncbi:unnamed protein product [Staurois parvus]|uniref:Uncharacterized protein n=1 Tax=Staurois parvus TaxID=386267 RepID=A0ABN9GBA8_9NEOB|nr:unnamed protein product [Staurois parvus]
MTIFSLVNPKITCIACFPFTGLIHFDPISGKLAGEKMFEFKVARKNNEGLSNTDVLLGHVHICKFLVKVIYERPNFVEPILFRVNPRMTECVITKMTETHYHFISLPGHCSREHGQMMNQFCGPI